MKRMALALDIITIILRAKKKFRNIKDTQADKASQWDDKNKENEFNIYEK